MHTTRIHRSQHGCMRSPRHVAIVELDAVALVGGCLVDKSMQGQLDGKGTGFRRRDEGRGGEEGWM